MKTSESINKIAPALLAAQRAMSAVKKGAKNPFFKSNYADLPAVIEGVKDALNDAEITYLQSVDFENNQPVIETRLLHSSGEWVASITPVFCKEPNNPQALGSGITYSKRYALQAICGLPTEDDDGERAMGRKEKNSRLPAANMKYLASDEGIEFLKTKGKTALEAIGWLSQSRTLTIDDEALIQDLWGK